MPTLNKDNVFADRFLLKELLGSRGISELWKAEDLMKDGAVVALKIFAPQGRLDEYSLELLNQDLGNTDALNHPSLLQPYSTDVQGGVPFQVLPYLSKGSLRQKLHEQGSLPEQEVAQLLQQVGSALFYLHAHELPTLHQNLNPDNILITDKGKYVVSDYGISSRTRRALRKVAGHAATLQADYSPPELFSAKPMQNAASDIFSFGVTLYEACSGEVPWMGSGGIALLQGAAIPQLPFRYSRELQNIVKACLDPDWEKRPTAAELEEEGAYFLEHGSWKPFGRFGTVTVKMVQYEKRSPLMPILISAAILLALFTAAYFYFVAPEDWQKLTSSQVSATVSSTGTTPEATDHTPTETKSSETATPGADRKSSKQQAEKITTPPASSAGAPKNTPDQGPAATAPSSPAPASPAPGAAYKKPASLTGLLQQLPNEEVPIAVRERWRTDIQRHFTPDAIVSFTANGAVIGVFTVNEMIDMLLSADTSSTIQIGNINKDEAGKIEELYVHTSSAR